MSVHAKLLTIQSKLKAPKNQYNSFGKYNYRSCEDILEGLKPLLAEVNATVQISDSIMAVNERFYVQATVTLTDIETSETISTTAFAREEQDKKGMDASQITGSVSSYARKYALNGLFCIDDTKDADVTNNHDNGETDKPNISDSQVKRLFTIANKKGYSAESVKNTVHKKYNVNNIADMAKAQYDECVKGYEGLQDKTE